MLRSLKRDESGIAMGLAIVLIVLVGVMGAGLLVFVQRDLEAVVENNRGQDAFEAADAGVQAAERQLLSDNCPESYGGPQEEGDDGCVPQGDPEEWHEEEGKTLELGEGDDERNIKVQITYLPFPGEEDTICENENVDNINCAPDEKREEDDRRFFQVESEGESVSGNARRKVESVLYTYDLDVPKAYYSPETIEFGGTACIEDVSVFSLKDIELGSGAGCKDSGDGNGNGNKNDQDSSGESCEGGGKIRGVDRGYGNWKNSYNDKARPTDCAGFGAAGELSGNEEDEYGVRDYDSENGFGDSINFPFDYQSQDDEQDEDRLSYFRDEALKQKSETGEASHFQTGSSISDWPKNSTDSTVVYVEADGDDVSWKVGGECEDAVKGTLVVDGANLKIAGNDAFDGITIVQGGRFEGNGAGSKACWGSYVTADKGIDLSGNFDPIVPSNAVNRPGFYGVELWSWRELYE